MYLKSDLKGLRGQLLGGGPFEALDVVASSGRKLQYMRRRDFPGAPSMGRLLLERALNYGPLFCLYRYCTGFIRTQSHGPVPGDCSI